MFDIGFLELLICGVIALLVLGPERLPAAARAAGRWVGGARRMVSQFTSELDRELKAEELREELKKAGDIGLDDVQKTVRGALDEAKKYEHMILPEETARSRGTDPANHPAATQEAEGFEELPHTDATRQSSDDAPLKKETNAEPGDQNQPESRQDPSDNRS